MVILSETCSLNSDRWERRFSYFQLVRWRLVDAAGLRELLSINTMLAEIWTTGEAARFTTGRSGSGVAVDAADEH